MAITNQNVRSAIKELIRQYKTETHTGTHCPLCYIFRPEPYFMPKYKERKTGCTDCPNVAFGYGWNRTWEQQTVPCVHRVDRYPKLDMDLADGEYKYANPTYIIDFWTQVLALIPVDRKQYSLSLQLTADIVIIARNINKQRIKK